MLLLHIPVRIIMTDPLIAFWFCGQIRSEWTHTHKRTRARATIWPHGSPGPKRASCL